MYLVCVSVPYQAPQTEAHHGFEVAACAQNNTCTHVPVQKYGSIMSIHLMVVRYSLWLYIGHTNLVPEPSCASICIT